MVLHHPPAARRSYPNCRKPARTIRTATTSQNILAGCDRLIGTNRSNLQMIVAQILQRTSGPPESGAHLTFNAADASDESCRSHRSRRINVGREIDRELATIPTGGCRIKHCLDRGSV